jgi:myo-inositol-1(or 4)-monophosphatase
MLTIAKEAAGAAAKILTENFRKITRAHIRVKSKNDFLTYVDEASEKKIIEIIHQNFPDHDIFAEETGLKRKNSDYRWIIDPLDGTKNYINGIPIFSISIALQYKNEIILGVVFDPIQNELFYAEKNKGAFLNGTTIQVNDETVLENSLLATGFPFKYKNYLPPYIECFKDLFLHCSSIRRLGSAAIDLAYVASGRFEGFWELGLSPWDIAAGSIIIKEAGGFISDFWKNDDYLNNTFVVASNNYIHDHFLTIIQKYFPKPLKIERDVK